MCGAEMLGAEVADVKLVFPATVEGKDGKQVTFGDIAHKAEGGKGWGAATDQWQLHYF